MKRTRTVIAYLLVTLVATAPTLAAAPLAAKPKVPTVVGRYSSATIDAALEQMKQSALLRANDADPEVARRARWSLLVHDIAKAATPQRRHELVRQLPVKVSRQSDVALGRRIVTIETPDGRKRSLHLPEGRPVDANGVPVHGPAEDPALEDCFDGPAPCATWEEHEDLAIYAASVEYEIQLMEADHAAEYAAYEEYCNQNPWACSTPAILVPDSTNAGAPCWSLAGNAWNSFMAGLSGTVGISLAVEGAILSGLKMTAGWAALAFGTVALLGVTAGVAAGYAIACYWMNTAALSAANLAEAIQLGSREELFG